VPASLSIGDFSRATHLSVKTLRHYHRLGLLEPADIDPGTGYRRYTVDQIPPAQVIRRFRDLVVGAPIPNWTVSSAGPPTRSSSRTTAILVAIVASMPVMGYLQGTDHLSEPTIKRPRGGSARASIWGAKWGADGGRRQATSGDNQS
jgi:MerR family regulatory protein